ncbi:hypothetical protein EIP86_006792 [Pleurotus ostreatoroseus]|nr:hypothetical protein EIP86_006792 [Pleurotus ostreatoroseus]
MSKYNEPTDTYELLHWNMVRAHHAFKLGFDKIVDVLSNVPTKDLKNLLGYCEAWALTLQDHHDCEEHVVFPFLNQKMDFSGEKTQHGVIHASLEKLFAIIHSARNDSATFNGKQMQELMLSLRGPLYTHLDEEVEHITADKIQAAGFTESEIKRMIADLEAFARAHANPWLQLPFMTSHNPPEFKSSWPPLPWALKKVLIPYVFAMRNSGLVRKLSSQYA